VLRHERTERPEGLTSRRRTALSIGGFWTSPSLLGNPYRRLVRVLELLPEGVPVLCTTATANDRVIARTSRRSSAPSS
jgi:hypothetical protein